MDRARAATRWTRAARQSALPRFFTNGEPAFAIRICFDFDKGIVHRSVFCQATFMSRLRSGSLHQLLLIFRQWPAWKAQA